MAVATPGPGTCCATDPSEGNSHARIPAAGNGHQHREGRRPALVVPWVAPSVGMAMTTLREALRRRFGAGGMRQGRMAWPAPRALYRLHGAIGGGLAEVVRRGWWTPVFRSLVETPAPGLRLD